MIGSLPAPAGQSWVRANWGRWVADCPSPWCTSAMQVWPGQLHSRCRDCGTPIGPLVWPADPEGVEAILTMRPDEKTRNWEWGETVHDLLLENIAHGIALPGIELADPDAVACELLTTADDRIVGGLVGLRLTSDARRHQIEATIRGGQ